MERGRRNTRSHLEVLSRGELEAIHSATLDVLEHVGVNVLEPRAFRLLEDEGAGREGRADRVRLPESLVMEAVRATPKRWTWHARDPAKSFRIGEGGRTRLGPGSSCTNVLDFATGRLRPATTKDGDDFVRLMDALELVDIDYTPVSFGVTSDTPRHQEASTMVRDCQNTSKPLIGPSFNGAMAKDGIAIAQAVAGGEERLRKEPRVAGYIDPVSPLTHDRAMTESLTAYAAMGQPVFITCLDLAGASSPATLAGTLVQQNAEILSGILIAHIVNRDAPVVYGSVSGIMDMKAGNAAVGGPEFGLLSAASVQLAHFYGLPCSTGGQSDARAHDAQAAFEKGVSLLASVLAGADFVDLYFGSFGGFNVISPEQIVIDHEMAGYVHRYARGIRVEAERLSTELIGSVGPGGSFLKNPAALRDTLSRLREEWYTPFLFDRRGGDAPAGTSWKPVLEAAHEAVNRILQEHEPLPLDGDVLATLRSILDRVHREETEGLPG